MEQQHSQYQEINMRTLQLLVVVVAAMTIASAASTTTRYTPSLQGIICQLFLGGIPFCPASSCKEIVDNTLWTDFQPGLHWLTSPTGVCKGYCVDTIDPDQSRGWLRVADVASNNSCPPGLEEGTAGDNKLCRKTVDIGCSSVTFPTNGISYSKVCGRVFGYQKESTDGFVRHTHCPNCNIDQQYVDGVSITHGSPRQHIWTLAASHHGPYCGCQRPTELPAYVGQDFFCDGEGTNTYVLEDRLWDGHSCLPESQQCCDRANWFCKELPVPTTDDIEFRVCADEARTNEDVYIEHIEMYVQ